MFSLIKKIVEEINYTEPVGDCKVYPITPIYTSLLILYNSLQDKSKKDLEVYFKDKEDLLDQINFPMVTSLVCNQSIFTKRSIKQLNLWNPLVDIKLIQQVFTDTFDTTPEFIAYEKNNRDVNLINYMEYQTKWNPKTITEENNNNIYLFDKFKLFKMKDFDLKILKLPLDNGDTLVLFNGNNVTETLFANEQRFWKITMGVFENPNIKVSLLNKIESPKGAILKLPVLHIKKTNAKLYSIKDILNKPLFLKDNISNEAINLTNVEYNLEFKLDQLGCNMKSEVGIKLSNIEFTYKHKPWDFTENTTYGIIYKQVTKKENKINIPLFMFCFCEKSQPELKTPLANKEKMLNEAEMLMIEEPPLPLQKKSEAIWGNNKKFKLLIEQLDIMTFPFNIWKMGALQVLYDTLKRIAVDNPKKKMIGDIEIEIKPRSGSITSEDFKTIWSNYGMSILNYIKKKGIIESIYIDPFLVEGNIPKYIGPDSTKSFFKPLPKSDRISHRKKRRTIKFFSQPLYVEYPGKGGDTSITKKDEDVEMGKIEPEEPETLVFYRKKYNISDDIPDEELIARLGLKKEEENSTLMDIDTYPQNSFKNPISTKGGYSEEDGPEADRLRTFLLNSIENKVFKGVTPQIPLERLEKDYVKLLMEEIPKTITKYSKQDFVDFFGDYLLDGKPKNVVKNLWKKYENDITRKLQIEGLLNFGFDVSLININEELIYKTLREFKTTYMEVERFIRSLIRKYSDKWNPTEVGNITWYIGVVKKSLLYIAYLEKFMVLRPHKNILKFLSKNKEFLNFRDEKYQDYNNWIKAIGSRVKIVDSLRIQLKNYWIAINKIIPFILREYIIVENGNLEKLGPITICSKFDKRGILGVKKLTMKKILSDKKFEKRYESALKTYYTQIKEMYKMIIDIPQNEQPISEGLVYRKPYKRLGPMWNRGIKHTRKRRPVGWSSMVKYKKRNKPYKKKGGRRY